MGCPLLGKPLVVIYTHYYYKYYLYTARALIDSLLLYRYLIGLLIQVHKRRQMTGQRYITNFPIQLPNNPPAS